MGLRDYGFYGKGLKYRVQGPGSGFRVEGWRLSV
jgi:hypothetical protein